ncbi:hypothetical protein BK816_02915 [Boudabousia tangfeifanii]|uniref:N-acyl-D-glucosamine 2-epimerase n=1 Tax=Boudabousia tangfeifanii TaxID=1912795 RepID=A0A1D9MJL4_9ACTO|nr:AGE family epimerase/isomerase [Boudabousia tangfeifanii]AOZ72379.1 hypothetical protein BK816_02915 [Boudabousia tangfeifanii]
MMEQNSSVLSYSSPDFVQWLESEFWELAKFGAKAKTENGFGYLNEDGTIDLSKGAQLWINARMTHIACLAVLKGDESYRSMAEHGLSALLGPFRDAKYGGWYSEIPAMGPVEDQLTDKEAYAHAFVLLAACSLSAAQIPGADELLELALTDQDVHWWDEESQMVFDAYSHDFSQVRQYRGANANMHTVEAYLAAADTTRNGLWLKRAAAITKRMVSQAQSHNWLLPEHYDASWTPQLDYNRENPADPFRPFGATIGHSFEWIRLCAQLEIANWKLEHDLSPDKKLTQEPVNDELKEDLAELITKLWQWYLVTKKVGYQAAVNSGFVYTVDWEGTPVVTARMHWVICEAVSCGETLRRLCLEPETQVELSEDLALWWRLVQEQFVKEPGRWRHEVNAQGLPQITTWEGMPDVYHAGQAVLLPTISLDPVFAWALRN